MLICEEAADGVHLVGHSSSYEQILVPRRCGMGMERRVSGIKRERSLSVSPYLFSLFLFSQRNEKRFRNERWTQK